MPVAVTHDTSVLEDPITGQLTAVPAADADRIAKERGFRYASQKTISEKNDQEKFGSGSATAQAAVELAGESATLGLYHADGPDAEKRRALLRRNHPVVALGAEAAGAVPAIAASELSGGLAAAAGLSARVASAASLVAEGGVSGYAQEQVRARETGEDIDAGNVFLFGIGGELAGRVIPKALGAGFKGLASRLEGKGAADALAGEADNLLVRTERRASQGAATDIPSGPQRDFHLRDNAATYIDNSTEELTHALNKGGEIFSDMGDAAAKKTKIAKLVGEDHLAQQQWAVEQLDRLAVVRDEIQAFKDTPGLAGMAKSLDNIVSNAEDRLSGAQHGVDIQIEANSVKQALQKAHVALGSSRANAIDKVYHDQLLSVVDNAQEAIRTGLEREDLFGRAALYQQDVNKAWHDKWFQGVGVTEQDLARIVGRDFNAKKLVEYDPSKVRGFLQKDKIGRGLTADKTELTLQAYEQMADVNEKWKMEPPAKIQAMRENVAKARAAIENADEVNQAVPRAAQQDKADAARDQLIGAIPVVGPALAAGRRALQNIQTAGKAQVTKSAGLMVNGLRRGANALEQIGERGAGVAAAAIPPRETVDTRFKGTYPTITQSFLAKRESITTAMNEPDQLVQAISDSTGDLFETAPALHTSLTIRMVTAMNYLAQNMPPGVENSLLSRHASPPDTQSIREFARVWEAVMNPGAVVQDFATMHATPSQARAIEAVHPDIFAQLQNAAIEAVASSTRRPPYERLRYLDQMFKLGAVLGGVWKDSTAKNIKNSMASAPANPEGLKSDKLATGPTNPRGIASIAAGPTSSA
jgi:hypothetical protein